LGGGKLSIAERILRAIVKLSNEEQSK
jgi:hypothetical protein